MNRRLRTSTIVIAVALVVSMVTCGEYEDDEESPASITGTTPSDGGSIAANGVIEITFDGPPGDVTVNGIPAEVEDTSATWDVIGLTPGQMETIVVEWAGGVKYITISVDSDDGVGDEIALFEPQSMAVVVPGKEGIVEVESLPLGELEISDEDEFTPERLVIDIKFVDAEKETLTTIDAELYVLYTGDDLENADDNPENLALGFWDGKKWIRFTEDKHEFELRDEGQWPVDFFKPPNDAEGFAFVHILSWGDRPIAWGRLRF